MAAETGASTNAILEKAGTWGTAVQGGSGDKWLFQSLTASLNETVLEARQIGSGLSMSTDATKGATAPTLSVEQIVGYNNLADRLMYQLFGAASVSAELTASQSDYRHTLTMSSTNDAKYLTVAYDGDSATVFEYPTCVVTSINIRCDTIPGYVTVSAELLANNRVISGTTNDTASLAAATAPSDTELVACSLADEFLLNTQAGGALSNSTDLVAITSYSFTLSRPRNFVNEIKGSAGNGVPVYGDLWTATLEVGIKNKSDMTWFTANDAETAYKCSLEIFGSQIGSGEDRSFKVLIPRMKLIQSPEYNLTEVGTNPQSLSFTCLAASANPTGMSSTYPYIEIVNSSSAEIDA